MLFLIGGVQPKTVTVDETPGMCPACGLAQARLMRVDHYLSLFFIPLFPVKKGDAVLICDRCGAVSSPDGVSRGAVQEESCRDVCLRCGYPVDRDFRYCPACGTRI